MSTQHNTRIVYACNKTVDISINPWALLGFPSLSCHNEKGDKCTTIYFPNKKEQQKYIRLRRNALIKHKNDTGINTSWANTFRLELKPCKYKNTYTVSKCEVHNERFCAAK
jgi:hypothetical protein